MSDGVSPQPAAGRPTRRQIKWTQTVYADQRLPRRARRLALAIGTRLVDASNKGRFRATRTQLARLASTSPATVARAINELTAAGYLTRTEDRELGGRTTTYTLNNEGTA